MTNPADHPADDRPTEGSGVLSLAPDTEIPSASGSLDTSGGVGSMPGWAKPVPECNRFIHWSDLDTFTQGYVEALFAGLQKTTHTTGWAFRYLAPETLALILKDCADYQIREPALVAHTPNHADAGRYFWRNRHAQALPHFPPLSVSLGDDGKVYLSPPQVKEGGN